METIKILDLFAGAGGLSLGFELVKSDKDSKVFEMHRAVELDKFACMTLRSRHGNEKVIEGDITKLKIAKKAIEECKGKVSVVIGGIPCQSFSLIGPRSGLGKKIDKYKNDQRDNLYEHFRDIVEEIKPKLIVIENVKGILSKKDNNGTKIIDKIISDFENLGYIFEKKDGNKWSVVNAADFGVPQYRERVILIGVRKSWQNRKIPEFTPTHFDPSSPYAEDLLAQGLKPHVTIREAIGDLPRVKPKITFTGLTERAKQSIVEVNKRINNGSDLIEINIQTFQRRLENISDSGAQFLNFIRPPDYRYIGHHIARSQQVTDIQLFSNIKQGETAEDFQMREPKLARKLIKYRMDNFKDKYRRQRWNQPSTTVFAHLEKDGNRFIHPKQRRTITPREAARLQSFPDDFLFEGPTNKKFRQIGNAVPPLLAYAIAKTLYTSFFKKGD